MDQSLHDDLVLRAPAAGESQRLAYFFRDATLPQGAQFLLAVRCKPVERFVAAVACWPDARDLYFRFGCQPGVRPGEVAGPLFQIIETQARAAGVNTIHYARLLPEKQQWSEVLRELGFKPIRSERFFELPALSTWTRIMGFYRKHHARIPATWRTESIRHHSVDLALEVIGEHRLVPPEELRARWSSIAANPFARDLSSFLFDGPRCAGVMLGRMMQDVLWLDALVVRMENPRLRSLGELCLLHHTARQCDPEHGPVRRLQFRAGQIEHRQTANLAFRMQGHELPSLHALAKRL